MGFTEPAESPRLLVRSYRTFSPLPDPRPGAEHLRAAIGGVFSVALSLASRPVGVIDHPVLRSPDFPPAASCLTATPAGDRPVHFEAIIATSLLYFCVQGDSGDRISFVLAAQNRVKSPSLPP